MAGIVSASRLTPISEGPRKRKILRFKPISLRVFVLPWQGSSFAFLEGHPPKCSFCQAGHLLFWRCTAHGSSTIQPPFVSLRSTRRGPRRSSSASNGRCQGAHLGASSCSEASQRRSNAMTAKRTVASQNDVSTTLSRQSVSTKPPSATAHRNHVNETTPGSLS